MALCRGSNAEYESVGLLEPRITRLARRAAFQRQRSLVSDTRAEITAFSKTAYGGCARSARPLSIPPFPHESFLSLVAGTFLSLVARNWDPWRSDGLSDFSGLAKVDTIIPLGTEPGKRFRLRPSIH